MPSPTDSSQAKRQKLPRINQAEQILWFICLAVFLAVILAYLIQQHWLSKRMVDIQQAPHREAKFQVEINSAKWSELAVLPGISETFARRIVEYRERHGRFRSLEELTAVPGLGPKTLDRLKPYVCITSEKVPGEKSSHQLSDSRDAR